MKQITQAILEVMKEVKGIDKSLNVGTGKASYKGVADKDVKMIVGESMQKHGLVILPMSVEPKTTISEWDAEETWNNKTQIKRKTSVLTEVTTKYLLLHTSGESIEVSGYGHGVDSQDKSAGKATTYALKNTLLYMFLVPTGSIDDTDATHSNDLPTKKIDMISEIQIKKIDELVTSRGRTISEVCKLGKINDIKELTRERAYKLIKHLEGLPEATLH
jgi:hypothetical protein